MVTVKYEDSKNGQTVVFSIRSKGDGSAYVGIKFDPPAEDDIKNPFGILGKLVEFFTGEEA